jgi:DNA-binding beta-propeller fold protein YncE
MTARLASKFFVLGLGAGLLASCVTHAPQPVAPPAAATVWPPPPAQPRIAFVQYLQGPRDIGQKPSAWRAVANWITGDTGASRNLRKPFTVAVDENGNLCLTDTETRRVSYANFTSKKWRNYDGVGKIKFASPVAVARHDGIFYVADSELAKVFAFRDDGNLVFAIGAPLKRPVGLAIAGDSLVVVDSSAHAVFVFGLDGKFQFSFGKRGIGPGEFNYPTCVAAGAGGHLIVADTLNSRVQIFDRQGKFLSQFGSNGDTSGHFARPKGVAVDAAGNIYVVDALFDNFQIFNPDGQLLLNVGEAGVGPGGFGLPNGIAISADNRIYVADAYNHRVQIFKYLGGQ